MSKLTTAVATHEETTQFADTTAIRPFQVQVPETELTELRRRINNTKWPDRETVTDTSQSLQNDVIVAKTSLLFVSQRRVQMTGLSCLRSDQIAKETDA